LGHDATNPSKITIDGAAQELPFAITAPLRLGIADTVEKLDYRFSLEFCRFDFARDQRRWKPSRTL
jgi:hypothetical protein